MRQAVFGAFLVACALTYGLIRLATPIPAAAQASLLLVQQNSNPWEEGGKANVASVQANMDLTLQGIRASRSTPDLAVWSESSVNNAWVDSDNRLNPPEQSAGAVLQDDRYSHSLRRGGVVDYNQREYMNAAILVSPQGKVIDTYGKMHPVPFAESIPFFEFPAVQKFFRNVVGIWNPWVSGKPLHDLQRSPPGRGKPAFRNSDLLRGRFLRPLPGVHPARGRYAGQHHERLVVQDLVIRDPAFRSRPVSGPSRTAGCWSAPPTAELSAVVGPWGEVWARMPFFEQAWRTVRCSRLQGENTHPLHALWRLVSPGS